MRLRDTLPAFLLAAVFSTGCLSSQTLVKLKGDGSGTIEQTLLVNLKAIEGMAALLGRGLGADVRGGASARDASQLFDEASMRKMGEQLGPGVRFVSSAPLASGDMQGARAIYAFDDIRTIAVNQNPSNPLGGSSARENVTFQFARTSAGTALLTVGLPEPRATTDADGPETRPGTKPAVSPDTMAMIRPLFQGMKVSVDVEVDGRLVKTTSPHVSGSRVTLLDVDLGRLLEQQPALEKLQARMRPGMTVGELQGLLKGIDGIKLNESPLTIEFAPAR